MVLFTSETPEKSALQEKYPLHFSSPPGRAAPRAARARGLTKDCPPNGARRRICSFPPSAAANMGLSQGRYAFFSSAPLSCSAYLYTPPPAPFSAQAQIYTVCTMILPREFYTEIKASSACRSDRRCARDCILPTSLNRGIFRRGGRFESIR